MGAAMGAAATALGGAANWINPDASVGFSHFFGPSKWASHF